jgi:ribosomal protein S11
MAQTTRKSNSKKDKNSFTSGIVHIQSTFNNTIVTLITNLMVILFHGLPQEAQDLKELEKYAFAAQTAAESSFRSTKYWNENVEI